MSSINTNISALQALRNLRRVDVNLRTSQDNISTGLKVRSGKDNAAYFSIAKTMAGDSGVFRSINEGLSLTKNTLTVSRLGAENFLELAKKFSAQLAFGLTESPTQSKVIPDLHSLVERMTAVIEQSSFNGDSFLRSNSGTWNGESFQNTDVRSVAIGISRTTNDGFAVTTMEIDEMPLTSVLADYATLARRAEVHYAWHDHHCTICLEPSAELLDQSISIAANLGVAEQSVINQQDYIYDLTQQLDSGIGAMIDADMEAEAAKLQAAKVQKDLALQNLAVANQSTQNLISLFK